jgi:catechol-2,3-dioxygenase
MNNFNSLFKIPRFSKYQADSIKYKVGAKAKSYYRNIIGVDDSQFNPTKDQLKEVYLLKLEQNPKVKEMLLENTLPFAHYYIMKDKRVNADASLWTADLWREIVEEFRVV